MKPPKKKGQRKLVLYDNRGVKIKVKVGRHIRNYAITVGKEFLKDFMESRYREERVKKSKSIMKGYMSMSMSRLHSINTIPGNFTRSVANLTRCVIYDAHAYIAFKDKIAKKKGKKTYKAKMERKGVKNVTPKNTRGNNTNTRMQNEG